MAASAQPRSWWVAQQEIGVGLLTVKFVDVCSRGRLAVGFVVRHRLLASCCSELRFLVEVGHLVVCCRHALSGFGFGLQGGQDPLVVLARRDCVLEERSHIAWDG